MENSAVENSEQGGEDSKASSNAVSLTAFSQHPGLEGISDIITTRDASLVASQLPPRERLLKWKLAYSSK